MAAVEIAERFAFDGVWFNLISYLTGPLGEGNAAAAAAVNAWAGVSLLLPLLGGTLADNFLGRYRTIALASMVYVLLKIILRKENGGYEISIVDASDGRQVIDIIPPGLELLVSEGESTLATLCIAMVPLAAPSHTLAVAPSATSDTPWTVTPCTMELLFVMLAFGGERKEDEGNRGLGMLALSTLLSSGSGHPPNLQVALFYISLYLVAVAEGGFKPCLQAFGADQFDPSDPSRSSFFNWWYLGIRAGGTVAYVVLSYVQDNVGWGLGFGIPCAIMACSLVAGVLKDAKDVLRLFPIWATCLVYAVAFAQSSTFFTKQAATLDRRVGGNLKVPPAALQSFIGVTIVAFIPVYDRVVVPLSRRCSGVPSSGITMLQRIGVGMLLSLACMALAALVEARRLRVARDAGLADDPGATVPMSLWWMVPQYVLFGVADVFTIVGMQEFFYDQVPDTLRSLGLALYLSILGVGNFISSALVSAIDRATAARGRSWFDNNLNRGHLDYFYWLLAALSALELLAYAVFTATYKYKKGAVHANLI
ncbi:hypothetical protein EJB05_05898, partial [Eragrostis curvula]